MPNFSKRSQDALKGVHPDLVRLMNESIKDTPIDFTIISGVRTTEQQKSEYAKGRTVVNPVGKTAKKPLGNIVTQKDGVKNKSNHQAKADGFGHAVDLYPFYRGSVQVNDNGVPDALTVIAVHIKRKAKELNISIEWGGDWKMKDLPHFELK